MNYINSAYGDLEEIAQAYKSSFQNADPFPNIHFRNFFNEEILDSVLEELQNVDKTDGISFKSLNEVKFVSKGELYFGDKTKAFIHFLNSQPFLQFLQIISLIEETLIPDSYLEGGGLYETKKGGFVKIHADINKHRLTQLDKRLHLMVFLNKDWKQEYGGDYELWNKDMTHCVKKVLPEFNSLFFFTTTDDSYHGSPDPLQCPENRSNKSVSLFYYSNGRPSNEVNEGFHDHSINYKFRKGNKADNKMAVYNALLDVKNIIIDLTPPVITFLAKKIFKK